MLVALWRKFLGGAASLQLDTVADFLADQFPAERRFGGDDEDFLAGDTDLSPAAFRAEKVEGAGAAR